MLEQHILERKKHYIRKAVGERGQGDGIYCSFLAAQPASSIFATLSRFSTFAPYFLYLTHAGESDTRGGVFVRASSAETWSAAAGAVSPVRSVCFMKNLVIMCTSSTV